MKFCRSSNDYNDYNELVHENDDDNNNDDEKDHQEETFRLKRERCPKLDESLNTNSIPVSSTITTTTTIAITITW
ncbi:hypothetical protein M0802_005186 [Mischocyttarus mexicanus]|nr:hypothetical protein M0802_005186 [Mischocyttarus mexicanus]